MLFGIPPQYGLCCVGILFLAGMTLDLNGAGKHKNWTLQSLKNVDDYLNGIYTTNDLQSCFHVHDRDDARQRYMLAFDAKCQWELSQRDVVHATLSKWRAIQVHIEDGYSVFVYTAPQTEIFSPLFPHVVDDTDIEVHVPTCRVPNAIQDFSYITTKETKDLYHGYWMWESRKYTSGRRQFGCASGWHFLDSGYDPRTFYLRSTAYSKEFVREMVGEVQSYGQGVGSRFDTEEFSETKIFNKLLVRRTDKYMTVRKFPHDLILRETCLPYMKEALHPAMFIRSGWMGKKGSLKGIQQSDLRARYVNSSGYQKYERPAYLARLKPLIRHQQILSQKLNIQPQNEDEAKYMIDPARFTSLEGSGEIIPCNARAIDDRLCAALNKTSRVVDDGHIAVGLVVVKGKYLDNNAQAPDVPRAGLAGMTLCVCLDDDGCHVCEKLGMSAYPLKHTLSVQTMHPDFVRELYNMYKYFIARDIIERGVAVFSFDLDIVFLRDPFPKMLDARFDIFVSTDAHVPEFASAQLSFDGVSYIKTSINAGLWYLRPTVLGMSFIRRVARQLIATTDQGGATTDYFFEQAQFSTVLFQSRTKDVNFASSDVRWKILSPVQAFNSKAVAQHEGDVHALCGGMTVHINYGCPGWNLRYSKFEWLMLVAQACNLTTKAPKFSRLLGESWENKA